MGFGVDLVVWVMIVGVGVKVKFGFGSRSISGLVSGCRSRSE